MLARLKAALPRRKVMLAAGTVAIIAGGTLVAVLFLVGVVGGPAGGPAAMAQFPPRPFVPDDFWPGRPDVLHVRSGPAYETGGETELWFDPRGARARYEVRRADGSVSLLAVVDGEVYGEYNAADSTLDVSTLDIIKEQRDQAWNRWLASYGWSVVFHGWITQGNVKPKEVTWRGQDVLEIEVPVIGEDGQVEEVLTFYLDKTTHLPVGCVSTQPERFARCVPAPAEGHQEGHHIEEWVPATRIDPALFRLPDNLPPVRMTTRDIQLTLEEARAFKGFDVYYSGADFQGQPLLLVREVHRVYGADWSDPSLWPPTHYVQVAYGQPAPPGMPVEVKLDIMSWPDELVQAPWEEEPPMPRPGGPGRHVTVAGVTGMLFEVPGETMLWLQLGTTVISINGENAEQVIAAANALQKLN